MRFFSIPTLVLATLGFISWQSSASLPKTDPGIPPEVILILDASGSMWGQIEDGKKSEHKIVVARRVLKDLLGQLPDASQVGLIAYGHRRDGDCADIETLYALGPLDRDSLNSKIDGLNPKGKTPITQSILQAVEIVRQRGRATTIVLVSDGLETCDADPCEAVRKAKAEGVDFLLHVVGFALTENEAAQLECAAQAGGGAYYGARNAGELADALSRVVVAPEIPPGGISVKAVVNGELLDVGVRVREGGSSKDLVSGRTYSDPSTNPRIFHLPDGTYDLEVTAVALRGASTRNIKDVQVASGKIVEQVVDFSTGKLIIGVTSNGALHDATLTVYFAGTKTVAASNRTYEHGQSNPRVLELTAGTYDWRIASVKINDRPEYQHTGVVVDPQKEIQFNHDFPSGVIRVGTVSGGELVDCVLTVTNLATGAAAGGGRTYAHAQSNPKPFLLSPGEYRILARPVKQGKETNKEIVVKVEAAKEETLTFDFTP